MNDLREVSGVWYGRYRSDTDRQNNSFIAVLEDSGGAFEGMINEPDDTRGTGGIRHANVFGRRDGGSISFVKQYDGSAGMNHAVHYTGAIDAEGTTITGSWVVAWVRGTFAMQREKFDEAELEDEEEVELVVR